MKPNLTDLPSLRSRMIALSASLVLLAPAMGGAPQKRTDGQPTSVSEAAQSGQSANGEESQPERIVWFGRWDDAKAEAARTRRPILLMSAAPQCTGAPGMW